MKLEESINHREFAAAGTMHPTMAKFMKPGERMDYYEPKNGDKVSGKVVKNNGKVVHVRHASGEMHKFDVSINPPKSVDESKPGAELEEAIEVSHDRYMRSHGKKASGDHGQWLFTHKSAGDVDFKNDKEVHQVYGKFSDAAKSAKAWAKKHGHSRAYVMEEVENLDKEDIDEATGDKKFDNILKTIVKDTKKQSEADKKAKTKAAFDAKFGSGRAGLDSLGIRKEDVDEAFADQGSGTTGQSREDKRIAKLLQKKHKQQTPTKEQSVTEVAKWRQGYSASGHPPGYKHKSGEVGPIGGTYTNEPRTGYDSETMKVPVQKYRDKPDELSGRAGTKLSTAGKPLLPKNAQKNLKAAIIQSKGKHGPVGKLPEQVVAEDSLNEFNYNTHVKMLNAHMKKLGYSNIGHGTDAHVFAKEQGSVIKVLIPKSGDISTAKNPFLAFLNYCKKNANNPHLPKFTGTTKEPIQLGSEKFDQVVMERLQEVDPKYEDLLVSITDSIEEGKPLDPQYKPYTKFYETLKSVMLTGRKLGFENDIITFQSVNIMQRGNTLVITDPWTGKGNQRVAEASNAMQRYGQKVLQQVKALRAKEAAEASVEGQVVFSGTGANGVKYKIIHHRDDFMIFANGKYNDSYGSLQRAIGVLKSEVPGLTKSVAEASNAMQRYGQKIQQRVKALRAKEAAEAREKAEKEKQGVAEARYPEVDHMPGPTIKRTQTGCKRCHGKGYVYKTPDGEVHPTNQSDAKKYKCGKCGGIGFVKTEGVAEGLNEFAQGDFNGGDDSNDLQLYLNVAKKLNMKKYKPSTAHNLIAKKMAELVDVVDDDKVDYARHMARKAQGLPSMLDQQGVAEAYSTYQGKGNHRPGWMLRADPELKAKFDASEKKQQEKSKILGNSNLKLKKESTEIMDESKDTKEIDPKTGKVKSWKHEGDWKKSDKKNPIGKIHQMSDTARRKTADLKEEDLDETMKTTHRDPLVLVQDQHGNIATHANLSVANSIHGSNVKSSDIHSGRPVKSGKYTFTLSKHHASALKEGVMDTLKKVGKKIGDTLGHGSDEDLLKDLQKKMGVPQTGKPSMAKKNESDESWRKSEEDRIEREARKKAGPKDSATVDKIRAMMAAEKIKKSTMKEGYEPFSFKQFNDVINEGDWKKETPWEKIPKDEKDEFGNVIKTKNIAKNLAKKARKQSEKSKSSPMENVHENELEEGWADMKKASTEFKKSIMSDLDKKNTKFTRFNKKETSTGTEYTRKPETFSDENDEASEKKSDKMKQAASGEKQEKRRRGRPAGSYGGSYKARSAEGKAASAAKAAATKAANRKIRGESLDDQYVIDLFRGLEEQTDRDDFYDLLGCDEFKCLTLEENTLLEEQFIAYENLSESQLDDIILEELSKDSTAGKWIKDFIKSENPRFDGKSRAKRKEMALAAYYAKQGE